MLFIWASEAWGVSDATDRPLFEVGLFHFLGGDQKKW